MFGREIFTVNGGEAYAAAEYSGIDICEAHDNKRPGKNIENRL
jgi:hypothetical protein